MSCDFRNTSFWYTHYLGYKNMLEIQIPEKNNF